jgi:hypothetical protein
MREKSHCTIFTIDSRNQESAQSLELPKFILEISYFCFSCYFCFSH